MKGAEWEEVFRLLDCYKRNARGYFQAGLMIGVGAGVVLMSLLQLIRGQ